MTCSASWPTADAMAPRSTTPSSSRPCPGPPLIPCARAAMAAGIPVVVQGTALGPKQTTEPQVPGIVGSSITLSTTNGVAVADLTNKACEKNRAPTSCKVIYLSGRSPSTTPRSRARRRRRRRQGQVPERQGGGPGGVELRSRHRRPAGAPAPAGPSRHQRHRQRLRPRSRSRRRRLSPTCTRTRSSPWARAGRRSGRGRRARQPVRRHRDPARHRGQGRHAVAIKAARNRTSATRPST